MQEITLTVNGQTVKGKKGDTVLAVCRNNDIEVPTLCHLEGISDVGACRLCVVEIEGERRPPPSCTYPARDGLVVKTHTLQLDKFRRQILELMFAERNHFCMFCEQSGDCELQALAYRYQMDNVRFQGLFPALPVDALSKFIAIDHNRCILCGRCVRACREVAAIRTLDFGGRGFQTMITADINQPLGESTCTFCGACLQACPTGAIIGKPSLYRGKTADCRSAAAICPGCDIGCELKVLLKDNNLVKIEAPDLTAPRGALCRIGRFRLLNDSRSRITSPMVRNAAGKLVNCSLDEAMDAAAGKLTELNHSCGGLISTKLPNETIIDFQKLVADSMKSKIIDTLDGKDYRRISTGIHQYTNGNETPPVAPNIEDLLKADCILVIGSEIDRKHPVAGNLIRRAVTQNHAKLIVIDTTRDIFPIWKDLWLKPAAGTERVLINGLAKLVMDNKAASAGLRPELVRLVNLYELDKVAEKTGVAQAQIQSGANLLSQAKNPFIIYSNGLPEPHDADTVTGLLCVAELIRNSNDNRLNIIALKPTLNSLGAWKLGVADRDIRTQQPRGLYLLLSDDTVDKDWLEWLKGVDFLVLQAAYYSPLVDVADIVLPSPIWAERGGTYVTTDGRTVTTQPVLQPRHGLLPDEEIIQRLAQKIDKTLSRS